MEQKVVSGYTFLKQIDSGGFSTVYLVQKGEAKFAAKSIKLNQHDIAEKVLTEVMFLRRATHNGVIALVDLISDDDKIYLIEEYVEKSLFDITSERKSFMEFSARPIITRILLAVKFLHSIGITHRDIKPQNILCLRDGTIKIIDFGLAQSTKPSNSRCGSKNFFPPEVMEGKAQYYDGMKCDSWSCGVTFYYMLTGKMPWTSMSLEQITNEKVFYPAYLSKGCVEFLQKLLQIDPLKRASVNDALKDNWISKDLRAINRASTLKNTVRITNEKSNQILKQVFPDIDLELFESKLNDTGSLENPTIPGNENVNINKIENKSRPPNVPKAIPKQSNSSSHIDSFVENIFEKLAAIKKSSNNFR